MKRDVEGNTPLHYLCKKNLSIGVISLLIKNGANEKNNDGEIPYDLILKNKNKEKYINLLKK
mgnify:CR=1 FL=1